MNSGFYSQRAFELSGRVGASQDRLLSARRTQESAEQLLAHIRAAQRAQRAQPPPAAAPAVADDPLLPAAAFDQVFRHMSASQLAVRQSADALSATDSGLSGYLTNAIRELSA